MRDGNAIIHTRIDKSISFSRYKNTAKNINHLISFIAYLQTKRKKKKSTKHTKDDDKDVN